MMNNLLSRRVGVASLVLLLSVAMFLAGYGHENPEAYLFPLIIASIMIILSSVSLIRELFELCIEDFQEFPLKRQLPVMLVMAAGVMLVEMLGIFSTAFLVLLSVSYWYSPLEDQNKRLIRSLMFSAGFCIAMYMLFSVMLNVQLPGGWLF